MDDSRAFMGRVAQVEGHNERVVRASEIGEHVYCARAWWLRHVQGVPSTHQKLMREGMRQHHDHARQVSLSIWAHRIAWSLILLALLFIGVALLCAGWGG